ncbi:hypothetical protein J3E68DRAFT_118392 [Trichoderma sp. SZMC 28012]
MRLISLVCMPLPLPRGEMVQAVITVAGPGPSSYTDRRVHRRRQRRITGSYFRPMATDEGIDYTATSAEI